MALPAEGGGIAGLGEHLGDGNLFFPQPRELVRHPDHAHTVAHGVPAGQKGRARGRAGRLGVHPGEIDTLGGHAVDVRRFVAEILLQRREADRAEGGVIPEKVDDVRRLTVFLAQFGQLGVELLVLGRPALAVLCLQNVVLRVVDNVLGQRERQGSARHDQQDSTADTGYCTHPPSPHDQPPSSCLARFPDSGRFRGRRVYSIGPGSTGEDGDFGTRETGQSWSESGGE